MPADGDALWADSSWRQWRYLSIALEQGSDGTSGWHALAYKESLSLNISVWWDWSYEACNDIDIAYKAVGKF
eukprot:9518650-Heterocapsa_arctica.AAC.1